MDGWMDVRVSGLHHKPLRNQGKATEKGLICLTLWRCLALLERGAGGYVI